MKRRRKQDEPKEKKERVLGCFWASGGHSGFVGRMTTESYPHPEDIERAASLASSWRAVEQLQARQRRTTC